MQPTFVLTEGPDRGQVVSIKNMVTTIGRDSNCDVRLADMRVSRHHAEVSRVDSTCEIRDLDSSNGTWVNGLRVKKKLLTHGDIVGLGSTRMHFQITADTVPSDVGQSPGETQRVTLGTEGLFVNWADATDVDSLRRAKADLETLYRLGRTLNPLMDTGQLVPRIMDTVFEEVRKVDRCSVLLVDPETLRVTGTASRCGRSVTPEKEVSYSTAILEQVLKEQKSVLSFNAADDSSGPADVSSVICAPMQYQKAVLGVVLAETVSQEHRFTRDDLRLVAAIGLQAAAALANAQLYERLVYEKAELDVANQKLRSAQEKLIQSEKLAAVGQLASGIVHDIKNPLSVVLGYLGAIRIKLEDRAGAALADLKLNDDLTAAEKGIQFCNSVVSDLLQFAKPSALSRSPMNINDLITDTLKFMSVELNKSHVRMDLHLAAGLPTLPADATQLKQVFINILLNAIQAADKKERVIRVSTDLVGTGGAGQVRIRFSDNGRGMTEDQRRRVFDPFFTTKPATGQGGTGLGLSVSYAIIDSHGGSIEVQSKSGEGSTFSVLIPVKPPVRS
jgi:signal transduction histidine kinase